MFQDLATFAAHAAATGEGGSGSSADGASADPPLRIVHVVRQYRPAVGGLEQVVEALAGRQHAAGHDVTVVTLDRVFSAPDTPLPAHETIDGIKVVRLRFIGSRRYPIAPGVLRHIRDASLVHVHALDFFYDFLALTSPLHRRPLIATTHGGFFHTSFGGRLKRLWFAGPTRLSSRRYRAIVACSEQDAEQFRRITPANLVSIENGAEIDGFAGLARRDRDEMLYFGRLSVNKGLHDLLDWFVAVRARAPQWRLTIAGRPDGLTIADLADQIALRDLAASVRLVPSPSAVQLAELMGQASIFVSASRYEGFGIAPVEAAAGGMFPVLRDIPPFARTIDRLGTGMLTRFATDPDAVDAVLHAIAAWREQGGEPRLEGFGWGPAAEKYARLYRHCCAVETRRIGKVAVNVTDRAAVTNLFDRHVAERQPLTIAFCNAHTVNMAESHDGLADALRSALVLNDGVGVDLASRMLFGRSFPENLNGTDLTPALLRDCARSLRIFVVGAAPGVADDAAAAIAQAAPRHRIVGTQHGFFGAEEEEAVIARIAAATPDLVLVGMGHPRQEIWAARYAARLPGVTMCVGALIDRFAGRVVRAPGWVRGLRAEWLYRLLKEPRRLAGRYVLGNVSFMARVVRQNGNGLPQLG